MTKKFTRALALLLTLVLTLSIIPGNVAAAGEEITEGDIYVFDRDADTSSLYIYQSPCMLGYDLNKKYGGNGVPIQAFVFNMYNTRDNEYFPTYCTDIHITAVQGADYHRLNLEDSTFSANAAGLIRAILMEGFYIIPIDGESVADHAARVNAKTAVLGTAAGVPGLTTGEAIAATQAAIWKAAHGSILSFPKFCRYTFNPSNTIYASLCSYNELKSKNITDINTDIETVYNYLLSLDPVPADPSSKVVSPASFTALNDPVWVLNTDGTYNAEVTTTVYVQIHSGDSLALKATVDETDYTVSTALINGNQTHTLIIRNIPASYKDTDIYLTISGYQTAEGYYLFDAPGNRGTSQTMVGYDNSRLPVFAKVLAQEMRVLKIHKTTTDGKPIGEIVFDIYPDDKQDQFYSTTPAEYTIITDANGRASLNLTQMGLPDGTYWLVERLNSDVVEAVVSPQEITIPNVNGEVEFTWPVKNKLKPNPVIYKDIGTENNNSATAKGNEPDTWIISAKNLADVGSYSRYEITDTLDPRLTYKGNLRVELEDASGNRTTMAASGYTHSYDQATHTLTVALTDTGRTTAAGYTMLLVYFDTTVNSDAQAGDEIPNQAKLTYTNNSETNTKKSDIPKVIVPTIQYGSIVVQKVDANSTDQPLAGAVFDLYKGSIDQSNLKKSGLTTGADGTLTIPDLEYGTYYLVETQAPAGYNRLTNPFAVELNTEVYEVTIPNNKGSILPETGGMGTEPFLFSGGLLVAASLLLLVSKKRRASS